MGPEDGDGLGVQVDAPPRLELESGRNTAHVIASRALKGPCRIYVLSSSAAAFALQGFLAVDGASSSHTGPNK